MIRLTRSKVHPIGIDIGSDSIRMLQLEQVGDSLSVFAALQHLRGGSAAVGDQPDDLGQTLREMLRQGGFRGRRIVASLPREILHLKNLRLPQMPASELAAAVAFEAESVFDFDLSEARLHFIPAGEVRQSNETRQEVILLAALHADVDAYVEQLHHAGLIVESLDTEPAALYRTVEQFVRRREDEQAVSVLVDVGFRRSQVVIGRGREINLIKTIDIGGRDMHGAVARKLGISLDEVRALYRRLGSNDPDARNDAVRQSVYDATRVVAEELSREIALCLRYYSVTFRGHRPSRVRLVGGGACDSQLIGQLAAAMPIPVEAGRPLANIDTRRMTSSDRRGGMCDWTIAFGLALRFCTGGFGMHDSASSAPVDARESSPAEDIDTDHAAVTQPERPIREVIHA